MILRKKMRRLLEKPHKKAVSRKKVVLEISLREKPIRAKAIRKKVLREARKKINKTPKDKSKTKANKEIRKKRLKAKAKRKEKNRKTIKAAKRTPAIKKAIKTVSKKTAIQKTLKPKREKPKREKKVEIVSLVRIQRVRQRVVRPRVRNLFREKNQGPSKRKINPLKIVRVRKVKRMLSPQARVVERPMAIEILPKTQPSVLLKAATTETKLGRRWVEMERAKDRFLVEFK